MAIANANVSYSGNGPTATGQILASRAEQGNTSRRLVGTITWTADASGLTATGNYIDGTAVLGFAPANLTLTRMGGASALAAATVPLQVADNANNGLSFTVTYGTAPAAGTMIYGITIDK